MNSLPNKKSRQDIRKELHLTRPPRLEGKVKNAMMNPVMKKKKIQVETTLLEDKPQGYTDAQRKDYQLRSKYHA